MLRPLCCLNYWCCFTALLEKEKKQQEDYESSQFRFMGAILSNPATDGLHFGSSEFCYFCCFHGHGSVWLFSLWR